MLTARVRDEIRSADGSVRQLARRFGVNPKTIVRWQSAANNDPDLIETASRRALNPHDELRLVRFRQSSALPLDDCLYASQAAFPTLSRSTLYRAFKEHAVADMHDLSVSRYIAAMAPQDRLGVCSFYVTQITRTGGASYLYLAIDHATKLLFIRGRDGNDLRSAEQFFAELVAWYPFRIRKLLLLENNCASAHIPAAVARSFGGSVEAVSLDEHHHGSQSLAPKSVSVIEQSTDDLRRRSALFMRRFNFERRILHLGGLRPADVVDRLCGVETSRGLLSSLRQLIAA